MQATIVPLWRANISSFWVAPSLVCTKKNPTSAAIIPPPATQKGSMMREVSPFARVAAAMMEPTNDSKRSAGRVCVLGRYGSERDARQTVEM